MRKALIIYPILFALNPILLPLSANISDVSLDQLFPMILLLPTFAFVIMVKLNKILGDSHRAGYTTFILIIWFFHYNNFKDLMITSGVLVKQLENHLFLLPLWTGFFLLLASSMIWKKIKEPTRITHLLNLAIGSVIIFSIIRISIDIFPRFQNPKYLTPINFSNVDINTKYLPDIYYIILDGYASNRILEEIYVYDNSEFINYLKDYGFQVAEDSTSNYMQTALSIASSLNFDYLSDLPTTAPDRGQLIGLIKNSRTRQFLEKLGYQAIAFSTPYLPTDIEDADVYLKSVEIQETRNNLESLMLINSIAIIGIENKFIDIPIMRFREQQINIHFTIDNLTNLSNLEGPNFIFAHLIVPHPPFIFDQHGAIDPNQFYILMDGNKFNTPLQNYIDGYTQQLTYINSLIKKMIKNILLNAKPHPIIIIQADHGPGAYLNFDDGSQTCHRERFSILNAYYLPNCNVTLPSDITPVNSFRIILNNCFNQNLPLLENRLFYSTWDNPYHFIDVSNKKHIACGD